MYIWLVQIHINNIISNVLKNPSILEILVNVKSAFFVILQNVQVEKDGDGIGRKVRAC